LSSRQGRLRECRWHAVIIDRPLRRCNA
jgi:hypothetical protein